MSFRSGALLVTYVCTIGLLASTGAGCGGGESGTPSAPTPQPQPQPPAPPPVPTPAFTLGGRVVSSATGQPIAGARVAPEVGSAVMTGADGAFQFASETNPPVNVYKAEITADGYVTRQAHLRWERTRTGVEIDLLPATPPFSMDFYRQLVRNGHEAPDQLEIVRRLTRSPSVYIQTVDAAGRAIDPVTIDAVQATIRRSVPAWSGGTLTVAALETGTAARPLTDGWIVVEFVDEPTSDFCGRALLGAAAGRITLNYNRCGCGALRVRPSTVAHETGHALGFWHVRERQHIMATAAQKVCPDDQPTAEELFHARLAYRRATGNRDPDQDPQAGALVVPFSTVDSPVVTCAFR